jgi:hypothetical protein
MPAKNRPGAAILVRLTPEERDRIRHAIPNGSLNAVTVQLLLDYARDLEASGLLPLEEGATTAA